MKRIVGCSVLISSMLALWPDKAEAQYRPPYLSGRNNVGLGLAAGFQVPRGIEPLSSSGAWGFYTDIPLLRTFHISPSTIVYRLDRKDGSRRMAATDISMNFKFIVPLQRWDLMAGVTTGISSLDALTPHMGVLGGVSFKVVSNLHFFAHGQYRYLLDDDGVIHDTQLLFGPLFKFDS